MSQSSLRRNVLRAFKQLHCARKKVFRDDDRALQAARERINQEFKQNKAIKDETAIHEMIKFANAVESELRTSVIQAVEVAPGKFEARITEDTVKLDNVEFDIAKIPDKPERRSKTTCCANVEKPK